MTVILIASYVTIPASLTILSQINDDYMILTPDKNICEFMSTIYDENKIKYFEIPNANLITINPVELVYNIKEINYNKNKVKQLLNSINNCNVYFDLVIYCDFEFWIVKELSKRNRIFYLPSVEFRNIGIDTKNLKSLIYKIKNRIVYKTKLQPCLHVTDVTLRLTSEYLSDVGASVIKPEIDYIKMSEMIVDKFGIKKQKVLLLCGGVADYFVEKENYIKVIDEIIEILINKYGIEQISIKAHPRFRVYFSKENELNKINPLIPAPFALNSFDIVIGFSTSAIHESSLMGKKVITLVKLFKPKDEKKILVLIDFIETNMDKNNPIYFPKNINEFKTIINSF